MLRFADDLKQRGLLLAAQSLKTDAARLQERDARRGGRHRRRVPGGAMGDRGSARVRAVLHVALRGYWRAMSDPRGDAPAGPPPRENPARAARGASDDRAVRRTVEAVWRMESAKIIGALARVLRDVGLAEELAQDALVAALEQWPASGVPDNAAAWLTAAAKHVSVDASRRRELHARNEGALTHNSDSQGAY